MKRAFILMASTLLIAGCTLVPTADAPANSEQTYRGSSGTDRPTPPTMLRSGARPGFSPAASQCLATLGQAGTRFTPLQDRYFGAGCSTVGSVRLASLRGDVGDFSLTNAGPVTCQTAAAFAGWARYGVDRAAREILESPLVRIETMGTYSCRNVAGTARRSAHSTASAVDVSAFVLADGRRIAVDRDWSTGSTREREFLRVVHKSACKRFGTVLGPDYNAAHADHLHMEVKRSGSFCR